jgi:hypothetical protein
MPGIQGLERQDHDECEAGAVGEFPMSRKRGETWGTLLLFFHEEFFSEPLPALHWAALEREASRICCHPPEYSAEFR